MNIDIKPITELPVDFEALRANAEKEGHLFLNKMQKAWLNGGNRFKSRGELLVGAFIGSELVGICGRNQDPYSEDESVGRVRHLYVLPGHRRGGVGKLLLGLIIKDANVYFRSLRVRTNDEPASKFYLSLGFAFSKGKEETHKMMLKPA